MTNEQKMRAIIEQACISRMDGQELAYCVDDAMEALAVEQVGLTDDEIAASYELTMLQNLRPQDRPAVIKVCRAVIAAHEAKRAVKPATDPDDVLWVRGMAPVGGGAA